MNARIKVIQAQVHAWQKSPAHDLLRDGQQFVAERHDMIAVPTHTAADMQQQFVNPEKRRRNLVGDDFRRVKVSRIQAQQFPRAMAYPR